jgi:hypothetical protein
MSLPVILLIAMGMRSIVRIVECLFQRAGVALKLVCQGGRGKDTGNWKKGKQIYWKEKENLMFDEPLENLIGVCEGCVEERQTAMAKYLEVVGVGALVGKHVKFPFKTGGGKKEIEHMWVLVEEVCVEKGTVKGKLDNTPAFIEDLCYLDDVEMSIEGAEEILGVEWRWRCE